MKNDKKAVPVEEKPKYRYYCEACTGIAFYSSIPVAGEGRVCKSCGKIINPTKKENYIKL